LDIILAFSPKLQALLATLADHAVLRDEKLIIWFSYPVTLELVAELVMCDKDLKKVCKTLESRTPQHQRDKIQHEMNDPNPGVTIRILLASMRVGGVGLNFQGDSYVGVLFETPETLDYELQVIGRQHRLGQLVSVIIYSLYMQGTADEVALR